MPKQVEVEIKENKMILHFIGVPIAPVKKALRENGFKCSKGMYVANITDENKFFVKLFTGIAV